MPPTLPCPSAPASAAPAAPATPGRRALCTTCLRPLPACLCRWVVPTTNQVPLLILQHPLEAHQAKGSVRLLRLGLRHCQVEVAEEFDDAHLAGWLYAPLDGVARQPVLLDGTWGKTLRLLQAHPRLQALPRWALPAPPPSRYRVRRAHRPEQRSTLEAACLALGALENDPARYAPLLAGFDGWVASLAARRPPGPGGA